VREDRSLQLLELFARLQAEVVDERPSCLLVGLQRVDLPARAVERQHQLGPQPFAQRLARDERGQLSDEIGVAAEREVGLHSLLERGQAALLEALDLAAGEVVVCEIGQRRAAP
jgi:hypothetical protein